MLFPEGTTHQSSTLVHFKPGAFIPGVPVQPVVLDYKFKHFDPAWVLSGPGPALLVFRTLCQFVNHMEMRYLPPVRPTQQEKQSALLFAKRVRQVFADSCYLFYQHC